MILFLLLLHFFAVKADPQFSIDWKRCSKDAKCFVEGKCNSFLETDDRHYALRDFNDQATRLKDGDCNIGIQIIPFSSSKVVIFIQVKEEQLETRSIGLYQNTTQIMGCQNITGEGVKVFNHDKLTKKSKPVLYEDFSQFQPGYAFCALTIDRFKQVKWSDIIDNVELTTLMFEPENPQPRPRPAPNGTLPYGMVRYSGSMRFDLGATDRKELCDPEPIKFAAHREHFHVKEVKNPTVLKMNCANYKKELRVEYDYKLYIRYGEDDPIAADNLVCDSTRTFRREPVDNTMNVTDQSDLTAYCAVEIYKTCAHPLKCKPDDSFCPNFKPGNETANATLECEDGKWLIDDEYYTGIQPECKDDAMIPNTASFYFTLPREFGITVSKFTEGKCFAKYDCGVMSKLDISPTVNMTGDKLFCMDGPLMVKNGNITLNASTYICNEDTGRWRSGDIEIPLKSRVFCEEKALAQTAESNEALMYLPWLGVGLGGGLLIGTIIAVINRYSKKYIRYRERTKDIREWNNKTREQKIGVAAETFKKCSLAGANSTDKILTGLQLIDTLLKSETEDPEIWELVYPFLNRLHGSSRRMGARLTGLLTRYLFVEAKKIIDKNGWTSPERITKNNHTGYIRVVAIRLIFYCRFSNFSQDVTKFIAEGFAKLKYNAVDQYPHCGLLWSHISNSRNKAIMQQFLKQMRDISCNEIEMEIAEDDQFPDFGNVSDQAAEALTWKEYHSNKNNFTESLELGNIRAILRSSQFDTGIIVRRIFTNMDKKNQLNPNYTKLQELITDEKMEEFIEKVMTLQACYGQLHDARRLEKVFLCKTTIDDDLKKKPLTDLTRFNKIDQDQRLFDFALCEEKRIIEKWLADRQTMPKISQVKKGKAKKRAGNSVKQSSKSVIETKRTSKSVMGTLSSADRITKSNRVTDRADPCLEALLTEPTPMQRIRTCQATEEEQKRYRELLAQIFSEDTIIAVRVNFAPDDVVEIMTKAKEIFTTEPMLIEDIPAGCTVVSDIHGQLYDLERVFKAHAVDNKPGYECGKYVFLGDYVDRGYMALEVIMGLFILKILYPDRFILLRGNHEFITVNTGYSFMYQIYARYPEEVAEHLYLVINECFAHISIAGIIGNKIFCAHAGISMGSFTRSEFRKLNKPCIEFNEDPLIYDVTWSDPGFTVKGVCFNATRGCSINFGEEEFIHAMETIECEGMIRGHQIITTGQKVLWGRLICIFTQTAVNNKKPANPKLNKPEVVPNIGGFAEVDENMKVRLRILERDESRYSVAQKYRGQRINKHKEHREKEGKKEEENEDEEWDWDDAVAMEDDEEELTTAAASQKE